MNQFGWENCPEAVKSQIEAFVTAIQRYLVGNLVGIYLHGSLAMGCFNPNKSDLDLLVVINHSLPVETKRQLIELLLQLSVNPTPIEVSFLRLPDLRLWQHPMPFELHYSEAWREQYRAELLNGQWRQSNKKQEDEDLAAHITMLQQRGLCLAGQPIDQVFPAVPRADYLAAILADLAWAKDRMVQNPVYTILNYCRVYAYVQTGQVGSKEEGGVWALRALPEEFRGLVATALAMYRGERADEHFDEETLLRFTDYVEQQINMELT